MNYKETLDIVAKIVKAYETEVRYDKYGTYLDCKEFKKKIIAIPNGTEALAAIVKYNEWDGRISYRVKEWAIKQKPYNCKTGEYISQPIHLYVLNQITEAFI